MQINERVDCIEDLSDIILVLLPELWSLGQSYFSGELYIKPDQTKQAEFKVRKSYFQISLISFFYMCV